MRKRSKLSIRDILRYAPLDPDAKNARHVSLVSAQFNKGKWRTRTSTAIPGQRVRRHVQYVSCVDPEYKGSVVDCKAIKISCDCERFTFKWEVALNYHGAADIIHSNGEFPIETNPKLIPGCCKHLILVLGALARNRKKF